MGITVPVARHRMRNLAAVVEAVWTRQLICQQNRLVHSNGFRAHVYGGLAAWLAGVGVWTVHGGKAWVICAPFSKSHTRRRQLSTHGGLFHRQGLPGQPDLAECRCRATGTSHFSK
jgi:hypothetical protein